MSREHSMNSTTQPPHTISGDTALSYVLLPVFLITEIKLPVCLCTFRIDRLRHQLLPVYMYDPTEELNEAEQDILWKEEDTKVIDPQILLDYSKHGVFLTTIAVAYHKCSGCIGP
uniref:Small integral membrane protein 29 n=1 Tax=Sinocyclocheilus grahami TaxID=75366 RepID=A0A672L4E3_SINGR